MYLKISEWLQSTAAKLRRKSLYYRLKYYIEARENYTMTVYPWDRGIGKTYTLVELAKEYNLPIFVPGAASYYHVRSLAGSKVKVIIAKPESMKGLRFDMVLFDEGLKESDALTELQRISRIRIGYIAA